MVCMLDFRVSARGLYIRKGILCLMTSFKRTAAVKSKFRFLRYHFFPFQCFCINDQQID